MMSPAAAIADLQPRGTLSGVGCLARRLTPATPARPLFSALPRGASGRARELPVRGVFLDTRRDGRQYSAPPPGSATLGPSARPSTCAPGVCQRRNRRARAPPASSQQKRPRPAGTNCLLFAAPPPEIGAGLALVDVAALLATLGGGLRRARAPLAVPRHRLVVAPVVHHCGPHPPQGPAGAYILFLF